MKSPLFGYTTYRWDAVSEHSGITVFSTAHEHEKIVEVYTSIFGPPQIENHAIRFADDSMWIDYELKAKRMKILED